MKEFIETNHRQSCDWAKNLLKNDNWCILKSATTDLRQPEVCQIAVIDGQGRIRLNSLVKPTTPISPLLTANHGITDEMVANAPSFADLYPRLMQAIAQNSLMLYNMAFELHVLWTCCDLYQLPEMSQFRQGTGKNLEGAGWFTSQGGSIDCVMEWYARWLGDWLPEVNNYRWRKLPDSDRTALGDCQSTLKVIREMAQ